MVQDEMTQEEAAGGISTGAIAATAVAAGIIAFLVRRARRQEERSNPVEAVREVIEEVADADLRSRATATREFLVERVLPEMKPVMLDVLRDIKAYVDDGFKRLERAVNAM